MTKITTRRGAELCMEETAFIAARKQWQQKAFAEFIQVDPSQVCVEDIPVVGIASRQVRISPACPFSQSKL